MLFPFSPSSPKRRVSATGEGGIGRKPAGHLTQFPVMHRQEGTLKSPLSGIFSGHGSGADVSVLLLLPDYAGGLDERGYSGGDDA